MQTPAVTADNVQVAYDGVLTLKGVSFSLPEGGGITGLIGPSGSGKTTLIRAITGAQRLSGGSLVVLGYPAGHAALRSKIGYVPQLPAVYADLTVRQNLEYFSVVIGGGGRSVAQVLDWVDLTPQANQVVATLSGGQLARVSLAIALLGNANLLLLDEPTVGLDPVLRKHLWQLFGNLAEEGKTLLISSHVMDEAEQCPELLLVRDGQVLAHGARHKLLQDAKAKTVEQAFLNLVEGDGHAS